MSEILERLSGAGVAIWLDDISRERLDTGNLADLVRERSVVGVTSNPTIFANALSKGDAYDPQLADLAVRGVGVEEAARMITTADIRAACDVLRPVYDRTGGMDGRVSIEVDPRLARETEATIAEARQLWWLVDRPNLFVKIPATLEGLPAISTCLSEGISVNVTLIFALERYANVIDAYFEGIERAVQKGVPVAGIGSVASFFVSRVDAEIDKRLDKAGHPELKGRAAVANARLAYELFERKFGTDRWKALADAGARPQRPLWASTGTKDPAYSDTLYVDELVVSGVVSTMPEKTLHAVADHGLVNGAEDAVRGTYDESRQVFADLAAAGIDYDDVVTVLEREGVDKFAASWLDLLDTVRGELAAKKA